MAAHDRSQRVGPAAVHLLGLGELEDIDQPFLDEMHGLVHLTLPNHEITLDVDDAVKRLRDRTCEPSFALLNHLSCPRPLPVLLPAANYLPLGLKRLEHATCSIDKMLRHLCTQTSSRNGREISPKIRSSSKDLR